MLPQLGPWRLYNGCAVIARRHGDDAILPVFVVEIFDAKNHFVLRKKELRMLTDGKQHRVLIVFGPDPIGYGLRFEDLFLTQNLLGLLVRAVGSEQFAGQGLRIFLGHAARNRSHLQQLA